MQMSQIHGLLTRVVLVHTAAVPAHLPLYQLGTEALHSRQRTLVRELEHFWPDFTWERKGIYRVLAGLTDAVLSEA